MTTIVSWNIDTRVKPWEQLLDMDADVALLQEVNSVPRHIANRVEVSPYDPWNKHLYDRFPLVVRLSDRVEVEWFRQVDPISEVGINDIAVSGIGHVEVARVTPHGGESFIAVSLYGRWMKPHETTKSKWRAGASDIAVHRAISDFSAFIGSTDPSTHRILVAGDFNMIYGATDSNRLALAARERSVWTRMESLGMVFMGPQFPAGRRADPTPDGLLENTQNVPTLTSKRIRPEEARNQLDYVFASNGFHESLSVRALNGAGEWGASDHCRILIELKDK